MHYAGWNPNDYICNAIILSVCYKFSETWKVADDWAPAHQTNLYKICSGPWLLGVQNNLLTFWKLRISKLNFNSPGKFLSQHKTKIQIQSSDDLIYPLYKIWLKNLFRLRNLLFILSLFVVVAFGAGNSCSLFSPLWTILREIALKNLNKEYTKYDH